MRVSEQNKFSALARRFQSRQSELNTAMNEVASGRRVHQASEDPVAVGLADRIAESNDRHNAWLGVANTVRGDLEATEGALESSAQAFLDARQLAMQLSSGPQEQYVLDSAADAVAGLRENLLDAANAKHQGRYLFGGVADDTAPFDATGGFVGSATGRSVDVGYNVSVDQLLGADVFAGQNGGTDGFAVLDQLEAALRAGDQDAVRQSLDGLDGAYSQVVGARQTLGHDLERLDHSTSFSENVVMGGEMETGRLLDTDITDAIMRVNENMSALQTAAEAASRVRSLDAILKL